MNRNHFAQATTLVICALFTPSCHRATVADEGAAAKASAFPLAEMKTAARAHEASPESVSPVATGTPMREAPVGGVPPNRASVKQR
jgi:hypothetical protein